MGKEKICFRDFGDGGEKWGTLFHEGVSIRFVGRKKEGRHGRGGGRMETVYTYFEPRVGNEMDMRSAED